jgi:hypothetical protein
MKGLPFSLGWYFHPVVKARINHCGKMPSGGSPFVMVGYTNQD